MRLAGTAILMTAAAAYLAGCGNDFYAQQIVQPDTSGGKISVNLAGSSDHLIATHRITAQFEVAGADRTPIDVWYISAVAGKASGAPATFILLHGLGESKANYLGLGEKLAKSGHNVVLIDLRAHGSSGGKYVTYGALEKTDVKNVVDELERRKLIAGGVFAYGTTLGGMTAIQYAAIDPRCKGVMAFQPYQDISVAKPKLMNDGDYPAVLETAGKMADFNPADASAIKAAANLKCPLLLAHTQFDMAVPLSNSQAIYDAAPQPKKLYVITPADRMKLSMIWEDWLVRQLDDLAKGDLRINPPSIPGISAAPTTQPTNEMARFSNGQSVVKDEETLQVLIKPKIIILKDEEDRAFPPR